MKKTSTKLCLNRETLRRLENVELRNAAGATLGWGTTTCVTPNSCDCPVTE